MGIRKMESTYITSETGLIFRESCYGWYRCKACSRRSADQENFRHQVNTLNLKPMKKNKFVTFAPILA